MCYSLPNEVRMTATVYTVRTISNNEYITLCFKVIVFYSLTLKTIILKHSVMYLLPQTALQPEVIIVGLVIPIEYDSSQTEYLYCLK